jgi:hypothetical protein
MFCAMHLIPKIEQLLQYIGHAFWFRSLLKPLFSIYAILYSTALPLLAEGLVFKGTDSAASLIELYSSEGCSSCPPAEAWTNNLKGASGLWKKIFPIAFHVDYWDGLGWPDRLARHEYTQRQREYAARFGQASVYTPEFIVNGFEWREGGSSGQGLPSAGANKVGELSLTANEEKKKFSALYLARPSAPGQPLELNVALLGFNIVTNVRRGENGGRKLEHDFVVLNFSSIPMVSKSGDRFESDPVEIKSSTNDTPGAVVAWVTGKDGAILQITGGWL